jgi:hypothetical protein
MLYLLEDFRHNHRLIAEKMNQNNRSQRNLTKKIDKGPAFA